MRFHRLPSVIRHTLGTEKCLFPLAACLLMPLSAAGQTNPVPFVDQPLVPAAIAPGGPSFTLTVNGTGFVPASVVNWNGSPRPTTFVSSARLTATIPDTDIATAGTAFITVVNPAPGGGVSNVVFLPITTPTGAATPMNGTWQVSKIDADSYSFNQTGGDESGSGGTSQLRFAVANATTAAYPELVSVQDNLDNGLNYALVGNPTGPKALSFAKGGITGGTSALNISAGGTNQNITLTPSGTGIAKSTRGFAVGSGYDLQFGDTTTRIIGSSGGPMSLVTSSATRIKVLADGRVAIGSADPSQKLDVQAGSITSKLNNLGTTHGELTFDASLGNTQKVTLDGDVTVARLTSATAGQVIHFVVCQNANGTWNFDQSDWNDGTANVKGWTTVGTTASTCSTQTFIYDGSKAYALAAGVGNM